MLVWAVCFCSPLNAGTDHVFDCIVQSQLGGRNLTQVTIITSLTLGQSFLALAQLTGAVSEMRIGAIEGKEFFC